MIPIGSHPVWHPVFETLAYAAGYAVFRRLRTNQGDVVAEPQRWTVLAAAAVALLVARRGVVLTLLTSAAAGTILVTAGLALPH